MTDSQTIDFGSAAPAPGRRAAGAITIGLVHHLGTGFAAPGFIRNATHDTRHALELLCH